MGSVSLYTAQRQRGRLTVEAIWTKDASPSANVRAAVIAACDLMAELLVRQEAPLGNYALRYRDARRMKDINSGRIKITTYTARGIGVVIRPGNNSTAFGYELVPPGHRDVDMNFLFQQLRQHTGGAPDLDEIEGPVELPDAEPSAQAPVHAPSPAPTPVAPPPRPVVQAPAPPAAAAPIPPAVTATPAALLSADFLEGLQKMQAAAGRHQARQQSIADIERQRANLMAEIATLEEERDAQLQRTQARIDAVKQNLVRADEQALQLTIELEDDADATQALRVLQGLQEFMNKQ